ncbi:MAG: hypothetical protein WDM89_21805 [Rhizomicrobium sp.]
MLATTTGAFATNPAVTVTIDATANRHAINPNIYGVAFAVEGRSRRVEHAAQPYGRQFHDRL